MPALRVAGYMGDHATVCPCGGDRTKRHNRLRTVVDMTVTSDLRQGLVGRWGGASLPAATVVAEAVGGG